MSLSKCRSFVGKKRTGLRQAQPERTRGKREQALTQNFLFLRRCRSVDVGDGRVGQLLHLGLVALALILADFLLVLVGLEIVHAVAADVAHRDRSEEHTSELQSLMRISYAVFCLKKKKKYIKTTQNKRTIQQ